MAIPIVDESLDMSLQRALVEEVMPDDAQTQQGLYPNAGDYSPDPNTDIMEDYVSPLAHDNNLETKVEHHATNDQQNMDISSLQSDYSMDYPEIFSPPVRPTTRVDLTASRPSQAPPKPSQAPSEPTQQPELLQPTRSAAESSQDVRKTYAPYCKIIQQNLQMSATC